MAIMAMLVLVLAVVLLLVLIIAPKRLTAKHTMPVLVMAMLLVADIDRPPPAVSTSKNFRCATEEILTEEL